MSKHWLIEYHFARGDFAFCQKIIQENLKEDEKSEYSTRVQGRIHYSEGQIDEALKWFQQAYSINPQNADNLQQIAKCLMHQGRYKKAVEALNSAKSLAKTPDFSILCDLASCHANLKEYSTAEDCCKEAGRICKTKEVYKLLSTCLIKQNKIGEAIETFRLALRMFPKSSQLYTRFGQLCSKMNFEDEALKTLQAAVKLNESNVLAIFELATIHQKRGEYDEAITQYRNALQINPDSAASYCNLGLCYFHKNKFVAALTCLQMARDLNPISTHTLFNLGLVYASLHQYCSSTVYWRSVNSVSESEADPFLTACLKKVTPDPEC